jgi:hypothetical protein
MGRSYGALLAGALLGLQLLVLPLFRPAPAWALDGSSPAVEHYRCDGDPLIVQPFNGPVDADGIPNRSAGTPPGAFVVLQWRGQTLQLPRTNNAGAPSYTDGRWWWSPVDSDHPEFRQRRGATQSFRCEPVTSADQEPGVTVAAGLGTAQVEEQVFQAELR